MSYEYGIPTLSMRLCLTQSPPRDDPPERKRFQIEIEGPNGKESVGVYFVNKGEVESFGEVRDEGIFISRGTNPVLVPILVQMLYSQSLGYDKELTEDAAIVYGQRVLKSEDFAELAALLGANVNLPAKSMESDGSTEYYLGAHKGHLAHYSRNRWIALARGLNSAGQTEASLEIGRGPHIARRLLEEGAVYGRDSEGKRVELMPAISDILPKVVGLLECVERIVSGQNANGSSAVRLSIGEPALLRALMFFTEEYISNSPIIFRDEGSGKGESVVEFHPDSVRLIRSVLKHVRVDLQREEESIGLVLERAAKKHGELAGGAATYRAMLGAGTGLSREEMKTAIGAMEGLGRRREILKSAIVGPRQKIQQ